MMYIAYKILANAKMDNDDYYTQANFQGLPSGGFLPPILLKRTIHVIRKNNFEPQSHRCPLACQ